MSQPTEQRPPQVTLASGIIMFASVMVLLTACERVVTLGSLETQEAHPRVPRRAAVLLARPRRRRRLRAAAHHLPGRRGLRLRHRDPRLVRPQARPLGPARRSPSSPSPSSWPACPSAGPGRVVRRRRCGDALAGAGPRVVRHRTVDATLTRAREGAAEHAAGRARWAGRPARPGPAASLRTVDAAAGHPAVRRAPTSGRARCRGAPPDLVVRPAGRLAAPAAAARPSRRDGRGLRHHRRHGRRPARAVPAVGGDRRPVAGVPADACSSSSSPTCSTTA